MTLQPTIGEIIAITTIDSDPFLLVRSQHNKLLTSSVWRRRMSIGAPNVRPDGPRGRQPPSMGEFAALALAKLCNTYRVILEQLVRSSSPAAST